MRALRWNYYIDGLILIILGALALYYPLEAIMSVGFFMGIGLIISGVNQFSAYYFFGLKRFILLGVLDFIMGVYMCVQPGVTAFLIPFVIGVWLLSVGISRLGMSLWLGGAGIDGWWLMLLNGIALIIMAVLMCVSPLSSALSVMMILACVFIVFGVLAVLEGCIMCRQ